MISRSDDHPITSRTAAAMTTNRLLSQSCAATAETACLGIELIAGITASYWSARVQLLQIDPLGLFMVSAETQVNKGVALSLFPSFPCLG